MPKHINYCSPYEFDDRSLKCNFFEQDIIARWIVECPAYDPFLNKTADKILSQLDSIYIIYIQGYNLNILTGYNRLKYSPYVKRYWSNGHRSIILIAEQEVLDSSWFDQLINFEK